MSKDKNQPNNDSEELDSGVEALMNMFFKDMNEARVRTSVRREKEKAFKEAITPLTEQTSIRLFMHFYTLSSIHSESLTVLTETIKELNK